MQCLFFEFERVMHINHPIDENLSHFLSHIFLNVSLLHTFQLEHKINHILFVIMNGILGDLLTHRVGRFVFAAIQWTRPDSCFDFGIVVCNWHFLINAGILFYALVEICDVFPEKPFMVLIVGFKLSKPTQLSVGMFVALHSNEKYNELVILTLRMIIPTNIKPN